MKSNLQCPVEFVPINENKARVVAFFVLVLAIVFLFTNIWLIPAFLVVDFSFRVSTLGKFSLLALLADALVKQFRIANKPTDRAPKRFAAGVGLIFSAAILVSLFLHWDIVTVVLAVILAFFAFLESFLGFCAGCYVYTFLQKFKRKPLKGSGLNT